jgi:hypothetical protein
MTCPASLLMRARPSWTRNFEQLSNAALMRITMGRPVKGPRGMSNLLILPDGK